MMEAPACWPGDFARMAADGDRDLRKKKVTNWRRMTTCSVQRARDFRRARDLRGGAGRRQRWKQVRRRGWGESIRCWTSATRKGIYHSSRHVFDRTSTDASSLTSNKYRFTASVASTSKVFTVHTDCLMQSAVRQCVTVYTDSAPPIRICLMVSQATTIVTTHVLILLLVSVSNIFRNTWPKSSFFVCRLVFQYCTLSLNTKVIGSGSRSRSHEENSTHAGGSPLV